MALFFFVVGLEARREFDLGELRERRRILLPLVAALGGMAVPIAIYLVFNAGHPRADGWGAAMSTDTAFALGVLALTARGLPIQRLRVFLLSIVVVDDLVALLVIATVYTNEVRLSALLAALAIFAGVLAIRAAGVRRAPVYFAVGVALWVAVLKSGIDPVIVGLVMGLLAYAYPAGRIDLDRATQLFRDFREQPTPELAREARLGVDLAISPNERLQRLWHPWTSYAIVPAVRAGQHRHRDQGRPDRGRAHLADLARDLLRLRGGQAGRDHVRLLAGHAKRSPAACHLAGPDRGRRHGGHRLHGCPPGRDPCLPRPGARGGQARRPRRGDLLRAACVARRQRDQTSPRRPALAPVRAHGRGDRGSHLARRP